MSERIKREHGRKKGDGVVGLISYVNKFQMYSRLIVLVSHVSVAIFWDSNEIF